MKAAVSRFIPTFAHANDNSEDYHNSADVPHVAATFIVCYAATAPTSTRRSGAINRSRQRRMRLDWHEQRTCSMRRRQAEHNAPASLTHHPFPAIHALAFDSVGQRLWIGAWNHLYCYDLASKRFITQKDSLIHQTVRLEPTDDGRLKAYTQHGLYITTVPDSQATQLNTVAYKKREPLSLEEVSRHVDLGRDFTPWLWTIAFFMAIIIATGIIIIRKRKKALVKVSSLENAKEEQGTATSELSAADSQPVEQSKPANDFIAMATRVVERHLADETFSIETFAQDMAVSRAQLFRKLKATNGKTPHDFILTVRMEHALRLLRQGAPLAEAAMKTGYSDVSNFRRSFIKAYGTPPAEYLKSTAD